MASDTPAPPPRRGRRAPGEDPYMTRARNSRDDAILAVLQQVQRGQAHLEESFEDLRAQVGGLLTSTARMGERQDGHARAIQAMEERVTLLERERGADALAAERERGHDRLATANEIGQAVAAALKDGGQTRRTLDARQITQLWTVLTLLGTFILSLVAGKLLH